MKRTNPTKAVQIIKNKTIYTKLADINSDHYLPIYDFDELSELYKMNSYHQRCINVKANITAGLGYKIVPVNIDQKSENDLNRLEKLIEEIDKRIDSNFIDLLIKIQTDYEIFGNAWIEITRDINNNIKDIYHIPAQYMRIKKEDKNIATLILEKSQNSFIQFGIENNFGMSEFLQIKNYNPAENIYGIPEYISALSVMLLDRQALNYNINRLNNKTSPEGLITISGTDLTNSQKDEIIKFFQGNFQGVENAGKVLFIHTKNKETNVQFQELKTSILEGVFSNMRKEIRDEIISIHGVPPRLVGVVTSGQLGGVGEVKEQNRIFKEIVIAPRKARLEYFLNKIISIGLGIGTYRIKLNEYDISDNLDDAKYVELLLKNNIINRDEAREMLIG